MLEEICPNCLRPLHSLEFGLNSWDEGENRVIQCRHCDVKLSIKGGSVVSAESSPIIDNP